MKINRKIIFKIIFITLLFLYTILSEINTFSNNLIALSTLVMSIWLFYKGKNNLPIALIAFFIFYCNYSVVIGEYLVGGDLGIPIYQVKTLLIYGECIRIIFLFMSIITVFYNGKKVDVNDLKLNLKDNILIFYGILIFLVYIFLFQVNRGDLTSYSVRVTPLYEYSSLLFLISYYFSGGLKFRKLLLVIFMTCFIIQDFYYGGRITSVQLVFLFIVTINLKKLSFKSLILYGFLGIVLNSLVGAYRKSYSLDSTNILNILGNLKDNLFVFDTPVYAYYASATQVAASKVAGSDIKINSFLSFVKSIFISSDNEMSNLTSYVSNHYFVNVGGGFNPTYFYFWFGWIGVTLISLIIVYILNKFNVNNDYLKLCFIIIITTTPRWYLYSPLNLFRPLIFLTIIYFILIFVHRVMVESKRKNYKRKVLNEVSN